MNLPNNFIINMIVKTKSGFAVKSKDGSKFLSKKNLSKKQALKRLGQIEFFKKRAKKKYA